MRAFYRHDLPNPEDPSTDEAPRQLTSADTLLRIEQLGWSRTDAAEIRARLQSFADDWDDPEMDLYDAL